MSRPEKISIRRNLCRKSIAIILAVCCILLLVPQQGFAMEKAAGATREEVCEYLDSVINHDLFSDAVEVQFKDTDNEAVLRMCRYGLVNGSNDGLFRPKELVSRQEAFVIVDRYARALGVETWALRHDFSYYGEISDWAVGATDRLLTSGIIHGVSSNKVDAYSPVTTHQLSLMLERIKKLSEFRKLLENEVLKEIKLAEKKLQPGTKLAVSFVDASTGAMVNNNETDLFHPASVIKDFYLYLFLEQAAMGKKSLEDKRLFVERDKYGSPAKRIGGTGVMQSRPVNVNYKWRELLSLMITKSDNVATNMVMKELGIEYINKRAKELGLSSINVEGVLYQEPIAKTRVGIEDMSKVLYLIDSLPKAEREYALSLMEMSENKNRIARYLKKGFWIGNKSGSIVENIGDTAIIRKLGTKETVYLTIFIYHPLEKGVAVNKAEDIIADLSKKIMGLYK